MAHSGLLAAFDQQRDRLLRYFRAHGAGDAAEDCLQELWIKVSAAVATGPIASTSSYLFRAATNIVIDRHRAETQARRRDHEWADLADRNADRTATAIDPDAEAKLISRQQLSMVEERLGTLPERAVAIFRRHRLDGLTQREVALEMGVSPSTVESDLRLVYRMLVDLRRQFDEE